MKRSHRHSMHFCTLSFAVSLAFAAPAFAGKVNLSALREGGSYDQFIVRFHQDAPERGQASARQKLLDDVGRGSNVGIRQQRRLAVGADVIKTNRKLSKAQASQMMQRLAKNPNVEYVELDSILKPMFTPNDTSFGSQWHYSEATAGINLPAAWDDATGTGIVVAVLDTGITPHSDLDANMVAGYDFITSTTKSADGDGRDADPNDPGDASDGTNCDAADSSWHGTHVAGTVAAVTNNSQGVAGVAFNAKVSNVRVLGVCGGSNSDIADAIIWASGGTVSGVPVNANPAEVINMSLGGGGTCSATTQAAVDTAVANGTVVVVSAGNSNADASNFNPASCNNVITIAAVGRTGARASYSNFGSKIDVAAPGGDGSESVLSTINTGTTTQSTEGYAGYNGTSMAAPHVAGTVALMQSAQVNSPALVETILKATTRPLPITCSQGCGTGIIDAAAAISTAITPLLTIDDVSVFEGNSGTKLATFTVRLSQTLATPVTYNIATNSGGTATVTTDYTGKTLIGETIPAGSTSKTFSVIVKGDTGFEPAETFLVNITNAVGATAIDSQGKGTILNDDNGVLSNAVPVTSVAGETGGQIRYTLAVPAGAADVKFTTTGGTGDLDMYVKFGSAPTLAVYDCRPFVDGNTETCNFNPAQAGTYHVLLNAFANYSDVTLTGTYRPGISINDVSLTEGDSGTKVATFTVSLSTAAATNITYKAATNSGGTATVTTDYTGKTLLTETILAGALSKAFSIAVKGDTTVEPTETFLVNLSNVVGAGVLDSQGVGTIINDDGPLLSINDVSVTEGNSGSQLATFTVSLSQAAAVPVSYTIATNSGGTATVTTDYTGKTLVGETIPAGSLSKTFTVSVKGDTAVEANETFFVNLTNPSGASIIDSRGVGTITNDD